MNFAKKQQQMERETRAVRDAAQRFRDQLSDAVEHSTTGLSLLRKYWKPLSGAISKEQECQKAKKLDAYGVPLLALDADSLAVITLRCIIWAHGSDLVDSEGEEKTEDQDSSQVTKKSQRAQDKLQRKKKRKTALAREISIRCEHEWSVLSEAEKVVAIERCVAGGSHRTRARERAKKRAILEGNWSHQSRDLALGKMLLQIAADAKIVALVRSEEMGDKSAYVVSLTEGFAQSFEEFRQHTEALLVPLWRPMVVEPAPWGGELNDGGYLNNKTSRRTHLVKHRDDPNLVAHLSAGEHEFSDVLRAVNALQQTPWRINTEIFKVMSLVSGESRAALKQWGLTTKERQRVSPLARRNWRWVSVLRDKCEICADVVNEQAIYFPFKWTIAAGPTACLRRYILKRTTSDDRC